MPRRTLKSSAQPPKVTCSSKTRDAPAAAPTVFANGSQMLAFQIPSIFALVFFKFSEANFSFFWIDYDGETPARTPAVPPRTPGRRRQHQPPVPEIVTVADNPFLVASSNIEHAVTPPHPELSPCNEPPPSPTPSSIPPNHAHDDDDFRDVFMSPTTPTPQPRAPPRTPRRHLQAESPTPDRSYGSPRAGQHSCLAAVARNGPAGNKSAHNAKDVWAFFEKIEGKNHCMICE